MALLQSTGGVCILIFSIYLIGWNIDLCYSQRLNNVQDLNDPRSYQPDPGLLDFVYHNHDEMTRVLRCDDHLK